MLGTIFRKPVEPDQIEQVVERVAEDGSKYNETIMVENPSENTDSAYLRCAEWCDENNATIVDMGEWYEVVAIPEPTLEEQQKALIEQYKQVIQDKLDSEARKLEYDNADRVIARQNSTNPKYRAEGIAFNIWYDEMWGFGTDLLNRVLAGEAEIPTLEEFEAMLPELHIDYENN